MKSSASEPGLSVCTVTSLGCKCTFPRKGYNSNTRHFISTTFPKLYRDFSSVFCDSLRSSSFARRSKIKMHFLQSTLSKPASNAKSPEGKRVNKMQYCAKKKWERNSRISTNKLRTFVSDEISAKFRRIYCSSPCEISETRWWTETKICGINRNLVAKFRESFSKFPVIS